MNLVRITYDDTTLLKNFLEHAGSSLQTFRYYNKRNFEAVKNHLVTFIIEEQGKALAYGHLDKEGDTVWLGTSVIESDRGRGLGNRMMKALLEYAVENNIETIKLAVDNINFAAQALYKKFGFKKTDERETYSFFEWRLGEYDS